MMAILPLLVSSDLEAAETTIAWNPSPSCGLAGYRVYVGTAPGVYRSPIDVGKSTAYAVSGLGVGTYYFSVKAYGRDGLESAFSGEISRYFGPAGVPIEKYDLNHDNVIDSLDLKLLGGALGNPQTCPKCDVNGDGTIDVLDLRILANIIRSAEKLP
jgi:hypothetical protein